MSTFRHHPDGWIYIDEKQIPLALFIEQEPGYSLPEGFIGREYTQGKLHALFTKEAQKGGEFPWADGDKYISKKDSYYSKIEVVLPPPTKEELIAAERIKLGVTHEALIEALYKAVALSDSTEIQTLKTKIAEAEAKYP